MSRGRNARAMLAELRALGLSVAKEPLAAQALTLAEQLDAATSQSGTAAASRELRAVRAEIDEFIARRRPAPTGGGDGQPDEPERDIIDELAVRRAGA